MNPTRVGARAGAVDEAPPRPASAPLSCGLWGGTSIALSRGRGETRQAWRLAGVGDKRGSPGRDRAQRGLRAVAALPSTAASEFTEAVPSRPGRRPSRAPRARGRGFPQGPAGCRSKNAVV